MNCEMTAPHGQVRRTDTLGNVITNELAEPPGWGEDMRWALALQASRELRWSGQQPSHCTVER
jgi:hypothetical protein